MPDRQFPIGVPGDFPEGELVYRTIADMGLSLIVCRLLGQFYAIENKCSHQERTMEGAKREYQEIRCPHHGVCYDLRDGSVRWDQGFKGLEPCRAYRAFEEDGQIFLVVPEDQAIY